MANQKSKKKIKKTHRNNYRYKRKLITRNKLGKQKSSRGTRKIQNVLSGGLNLYGIGRGIGRGIARETFFMMKEAIMGIIFGLHTLIILIPLCLYISWVLIIIVVLVIPSGGLILNYQGFVDKYLDIDMIVPILEKYTRMFEKLDDWQQKKFDRGGKGNTFKGGGFGVNSILKPLQDQLGKTLCISLLSAVLTPFVHKSAKKKVSESLYDLIESDGAEPEYNKLVENMAGNLTGYNAPKGAMELAGSIIENPLLNSQSLIELVSSLLACLLTNNQTQVTEEKNTQSRFMSKINRGIGKIKAYFTISRTRVNKKEADAVSEALDTVAARADRAELVTSSIAEEHTGLSPAPREDNIEL